MHSLRIGRENALDLFRAADIDASVINDITSDGLLLTMLPRGRL